MRSLPLVLVLLLACDHDETVVDEDTLELRVDGTCPSPSEVLREQTHLDEAELTSDDVHERLLCWYRAELAPPTHATETRDAGIDAEAAGAGEDGGAEELADEDARYGTQPGGPGCQNIGTFDELRQRRFEMDLFYGSGSPELGRAYSVCTREGLYVYASAVDGACLEPERFEPDPWNVRATESLGLERRTYRSCVYATRNEYERGNGGCGTLPGFAPP